MAGRRLGSWDEVGGSTGATFLDSWKKEGNLQVVLHREPPWIRNLHNFRKVVKEDERGRLTKKIAWFPFVCWEDEEFHRQQRINKDDPPHAELCPACRLIDHLHERDDLADEDVIFRFQGSGRGELREILKVDFLGHGNRKNSFQDDFTATTDYLIPVIPVDDPTKTALTNERWSMGKALRKRIKTDIKVMGEEGDPSKYPTAYSFEYDDESRTYSVSRADRVKITDAIRELWEEPSPDASSYIAPGDPTVLLEAMRDGAADGVDLPLDEIFAPALARWSKTSDDRSPKDEEAEEEAPKKKESKAKPPRSKKPEPKQSDEDARQEPKSKSKAAKEEESKAERKTRPTKKAEPPKQEEEDLGTIYACPSCGGDWPEKLPRCPNPKCDAVAEDAPDEPEPAKGKRRSDGEDDVPW